MVSRSPAERLEKDQNADRHNPATGRTWWRRSLHAVEAIPIALLLLLGAVWLSFYTLLAVAALPAFVVALIGIFHPRYFDASSRGIRRRWWVVYLHAMALVSCVAIIKEVLEVLSTGR